MKTKPKKLWDASATALLATNLFTMFLALWQKWNVGDLMLAYWAQSVTIGYFNFQRMRSLKDFTTAGLKMNGSSVRSTKTVQREVSWFFAAHYGLFHVVYFIFLLAGAVKAELDLPWVLLSVVGFIANHAFSYRHNRVSDEGRKINIGTLLFFPYARIIPMHLTIIFGGLFISKSNSLVLLLFLALKTIADLIMHFVEHSLGLGKEEVLDGQV